MRLFPLLAALLLLSSCGESFDAEVYADAAEDVVWAKANGLAADHAHRIKVEGILEELASDDIGENRAAIQSRIKKLEAAYEEQIASRSESDRQLHRATTMQITIDGLKEMQALQNPLGQDP